MKENIIVPNLLMEKYAFSIVEKACTVSSAIFPYLFIYAQLNTLLCYSPLIISQYLD